MKTADSMPRFFWLDNTKYVLLCCLLVDHFLLPLSPQNHLRQGLFLMLTWALMPTFAFMSGYLIKKEEVTVNVGRQLISRLLIPYAIMEVMLKACLSIAMIVSPDPTKWHWTFGSMTDWSLLFVTPTFQGWYLISLCVWRLVLPLVSTLRCNVFIAFLASILIGFTDAGALFGISRTVCFFPFFLLGFILRQRFPQDSQLHEALKMDILLPGHSAFTSFFTTSKLLAVIMLAVVAQVTVWWESLVPWAMMPIFYVHPYHVIGLNWYICLTRVGAMLLAIITGWSIMTLVPRREIWFISIAGTKTMYPLMLHMFVIVILAALNGFMIVGEGTLATILVIILALSMTALLSTDLVRRHCRKLLEPEWSAVLFDC